MTHTLWQEELIYRTGLQTTIRRLRLCGRPDSTQQLPGNNGSNWSGHADRFRDSPILSFAEAFDDDDLFWTPKWTVLVTVFDDFAGHHLADSWQPFKLFGGGCVQVDTLSPRRGFARLDCGRLGDVLTPSAGSEREEQECENEQTHSTISYSERVLHEGSRRFGGGVAGNVTPS